MSCARRRQAAIVERYGPLVQTWRAYHLTLSRESVEAERLRQEVDHFKASFRSAVLRTRRTLRIPVRALRKVEVTWDWRTDRYHVHLHVLVDGRAAATALLETWLGWHRETVHRRGQHIQQCGMTEVVRLLAYLGKAPVQVRSVPGRRSPKLTALDAIYQAAQGRLFEAYGVPSRRQATN